MDRTERLLTRVALEELNAEFAYLIDHDLSEQVADLFTENGSYGRSTGERSVGREAIRAAYRGRKSKGPRTARHITLKGQRSSATKYAYPTRRLPAVESGAGFFRYPTPSKGQGDLPVCISHKRIVSLFSWVSGPFIGGELKAED